MAGRGAAVRARARADAARRGGGGGAAGRPLPRHHRDPALRRCTARGRWRGPATGSITYDARGHGESDPAPAGEGYGYPQLVERPGAGGGGAGGRGALRPRRPLDGRPHRRRLRAAPSRAPGGAGRDRAGLRRRDRSRRRSPTGTASRRRWKPAASTASSPTSTREQGIDPRWRDSVLRFTRERMLAQRHPEALAQALREVPRSRPFELARGAAGARGPGAGRRQQRRRRPRPSLRGGRRLRRGAAAGTAGQRGARASRRSPGRAASSRRALAAFYAEALSSAR